MEQAIAASHPPGPGQDFSRLKRDDTQMACSQYRNNPPEKPAAAIIERESKHMKYPDGGNCCACHAADPKEVAAGNVGPSLTGYGKLRGMSEEIIMHPYEKNYSLHRLLQHAAHRPPRHPQAGADRRRHGLPAVAGVPGQRVTRSSERAWYPASGRRIVTALRGGSCSRRRRARPRSGRGLAPILG